MKKKIVYSLTAISFIVVVISCFNRDIPSWLTSSAIGYMLLHSTYLIFSQDELLKLRTKIFFIFSGFALIFALTIFQLNLFHRVPQLFLVIMTFYASILPLALVVKLINFIIEILSKLIPDTFKRRFYRLMNIALKFLLKSRHF